MDLCFSVARRITQIEQPTGEGLGSERFPTRGENGLVISESLRRTSQMVRGHCA